MSWVIPNFKQSKETIWTICLFEICFFKLLERDKHMVAKVWPYDYKNVYIYTLQFPRPHSLSLSADGEAFPDKEVIGG